MRQFSNETDSIGNRTSWLVGKCTRGSWDRRGDRFYSSTTDAPVRALSSVDFPAFVYPDGSQRPEIALASLTLGRALAADDFKLFGDFEFAPAPRRSVSNCVSPSPRIPMPAFLPRQMAPETGQVEAANAGVAQFNLQFSFPRARALREISRISGSAIEMTLPRNLDLEVPVWQSHRSHFADSRYLAQRARTAGRKIAG